MQAVAVNRLQQRLRGIVAGVDACVTVADRSGRLARINAQLPLAAASTQKLLVSTAALAVLGARHRFITRAVTTAERSGGVLAGDLIIVGGGDPVLTTATDPTAPATRLSDLADAIARTGITRIAGALVADDSRYDRVRAVPDWKPSEVAEGDVGALGALVVNGGYSVDAHTATPNPALDTVNALAGLLEARGVQIANGAVDPGVAAPASARRIARVESPRLGAIVAQMLTVSNNETAELLTREIGVEGGTAGTTAAGTKAVQSVLAKLGVPTAGMNLHDGSGLAPDDRVTCSALLHVIALTGEPRFAAIDRGLPVAARTGTLALRFAGTPLAGRLRAKTGSIGGVVGLAGVLGSQPAAVPRFAFVANGNFSTAAGAQLQDEIAEAIGAYPDAPDPAKLVPAP